MTNIREIRRDAKESTAETTAGEAKVEEATSLTGIDEAQEDIVAV